MKHNTLFQLLFLTTMITCAQRIDEAIKKWQHDPDLQAASFGISIYNLDKNSTVTAINEDKSLIPASTLKVITTATALELLGPDHRFETKIGYTGQIDSMGVLSGDIVVIGGADPTLGSSRFGQPDQLGKIPAYQQVLTQVALNIQKSEIKVVKGSLLIDASIFEKNCMPETWSWVDMGNYYGGQPSGLSINENLQKLYFASGTKPNELTKLVKSDPMIPGLKIINEVKSANIRNDQAYIYGAPYQHERLATGYIPLNRSRFEVKASIPDPPLLFGQLLKNELQKINIAVDSVKINYRKGVNHALKPIMTITSPTLAAIISKTNHHSINLYAEHLRITATQKISDGTNVQDTQPIVQFWKNRGMPTTGFFIEDGSGLSRQNAITTAQLRFILQHMHSSPNVTSFKKSLPIAGQSGTLRNLCKGTLAAGNLQAKSGYLSRVRSYAGYVKSASGDLLCFAIIVNNFTCTPYQMRKKMEQIMVALSNYNE